ncbi:MAG: hypothetical protein P8I55_00020 [Crocinitomix sp.]|nr:hypothetical protein [Crocinitomix sp.]
MSYTIGKFKSNPLSEKTEVLKKISKIEFHDMPVNWFKIQLGSENAFTIQITPYVEVLKEYEIINIKCNQILIFEIDGYKFNDKWTLEIGSFEYEWNNNFEGRLYLLPGWNQGGIEINF